MRTPTPIGNHNVESTPKSQLATQFINVMRRTARISMHRLKPIATGLPPPHRISSFNEQKPPAWRQRAASKTPGLEQIRNHSVAFQPKSRPAMPRRALKDPLTPSLKRNKRAPRRHSSDKRHKPMPTQQNRRCLLRSTTAASRS